VRSQSLTNSSRVEARVQRWRIEHWKVCTWTGKAIGHKARRLLHEREHKVGRHVLLRHCALCVQDGLDHHCDGARHSVAVRCEGRIHVCLDKYIDPMASVHPCAELKQTTVRLLLKPKGAFHHILKSYCTLNLNFLLHNLISELSVFAF
jgi:hypothetical protein